MSVQQVANPLAPLENDLLERIIVDSDLSGMNSSDRAKYIINLCHQLGLNPLTKPIQLIRFNGKLIIYFTKDATEQLRKLNRISIAKIDAQILDGIYVVTAYAMSPDGRQDSSTGVVTISGLKGEPLANAMMKAETKAKRRVTLSICGLGFMDECEIDSLIGAQKVDAYSDTPQLSVIKNENIEFNLSVSLAEIEKCQTLDALKSAYSEIYKKNRNNPELLEKVTLAKDEKKENFMRDEFITNIALLALEGQKTEILSQEETINIETGEIQ
jgi:hypothetical protein